MKKFLIVAVIELLVLTANAQIRDRDDRGKERTSCEGCSLQRRKHCECCGEWYVNQDHAHCCETFIGPRERDVYIEPGELRKPQYRDSDDSREPRDEDRELKQPRDGNYVDRTELERKRDR